jgi:hypothetical protein
VRGIVHDEVYTGAGGYPPIIDRDRWERIVDKLPRLDPVAVRARKGGRPTTEEYLLRGVAFCGRCGSSMYTRRYAAGRHYTCGAVRQATGTCTAPSGPAAPVEDQALRHLGNYKGDIRQWLDEQVAEGHDERAKHEREADRERKALAKLERTIVRLQEDLDEDAEIRRSALRELDRLEREREAQAAAVTGAEARVAEWTARPDVDRALDYSTPRCTR